MHKLTIASVLMLGLGMATGTTSAQTPQITGRYRAVALPKVASDASDKALIIDTVTGDLWEWHSTPGSGNQAPATGLLYMGHVQPGTIDRRRGG